MTLTPEERQATEQANAEATQRAQQQEQLANETKLEIINDLNTTTTLLSADSTTTAQREQALKLLVRAVTKLSNQLHKT